MSNETTTPAARDEREVVSTAPERIYLIIGEECPDSARFKDLTDVSWCEDKIDSNAIPYVKAAIAESELAEVREQVEDARRTGQYWKDEHAAAKTAGCNPVH